MSDFYRIRQSADFVLSTLSCQYGIFLFDEQACVVDLRQSSAAVECDVNRRLHDIGLFHLLLVYYCSRKESAD